MWFHRRKNSLNWKNRSKKMNASILSKKVISTRQKQAANSDENICDIQVLEEKSFHIKNMAEITKLANKLQADIYLRIDGADHKLNDNVLWTLFGPLEILKKMGLWCPFKGAGLYYKFIIKGYKGNLPPLQLRKKLATALNCEGPTIGMSTAKATNFYITGLLKEITKLNQQLDYSTQQSEIEKMRKTIEKLLKEKEKLQAANESQRILTTEIRIHGGVDNIGFGVILRWGTDTVPVTTKEITNDKLPKENKKLNDWQKSAQENKKTKLPESLKDHEGLNNQLLYIFKQAQNILSEEKITAESAIVKAYNSAFAKAQGRLIEIIENVQALIWPIIFPNREILAKNAENITESFILVTDKITSAQIPWTNKNLKGIIIEKDYYDEQDGRPSHLAGDCKAYNIPLFIIPKALQKINPTDNSIILDPKTAKVIVNPSVLILREYNLEQSKEQKILAIKDTISRQISKTKDDCYIPVAGNIKYPEDILGLKGIFINIGLWRTEYLFFGKNENLTKADLIEKFQAASENGHLLDENAKITVRMPDFTADKKDNLPPAIKNLITETKKEGLEFLLHDKVKEPFTKLFIKALLKANKKHENFKLIIPQDKTEQQIDNFNKLVDEVKKELEYKKDFPTGVMVENEAAFKLFLENDDIWSKVRTLNIGDNDAQKDIKHIPTLFDYIIKLAKKAYEKQMPLCICGARASQPKSILALMGLLADQTQENKKQHLTFSCEKGSISDVNAAIIGVSLDKLKINSIIKSLKQKIKDHQELSNDGFLALLDTLHTCYEEQIEKNTLKVFQYYQEFLQELRSLQATANIMKNDAQKVTAMLHRQLRINGVYALRTQAINIIRMAFDKYPTDPSKRSNLLHEKLTALFDEQIKKYGMHMAKPKHIATMTENDLLIRIQKIIIAESIPHKKILSLHALKHEDKYWAYCFGIDPTGMESIYYLKNVKNNYVTLNTGSEQTKTVPIENNVEIKWFHNIRGQYRLHRTLLNLEAKAPLTLFEQINTNTWCKLFKNQDSDRIMAIYKKNDDNKDGTLFIYDGPQRFTIVEGVTEETINNEVTISALNRIFSHVIKQETETNRARESLASVTSVINKIEEMLALLDSNSKEYKQLETLLKQQQGRLLTLQRRP